MYQGRYSSQKRKTKNRKPLVLVASLAVLVCAVVGGTIAWLTAATPNVTNTFTPAKVTCAVDEQFNGTTKEHVQIKNTGDIDAYIRARIIVSWQDDAGNILGQAPDSSSYSITLGSDWTKGNDGYYYYGKSVAPNDHTADLIASVTRTVPNDIWAGYDLAVEIIAEAIQAEGSTNDGIPAVENAWPAWPY